MLRAFFSFDTFVFPSLVKVIYWIGLVLIVLATIVAAVGAIAASGNPYMGGGAGAGVIGLIVALIGGVVSLVFWRVAIELWLVLFSMHDLLREIRDQRRS